MTRFPRAVRSGLTDWIPANDAVKVPHKLTDAEIIAVRERCRPESGRALEPYDSIGRSFGVTGQTVARIARGELRASVGGPVEGRDYARPNRRNPFV